MERVTTKHAIDGVQSRDQPYPPSWVDRLLEWVQRLPLSGWLFYLVSGLALYVVYTAIKWSDGTYPVGEYTLFPVLVCLTCFYYLAMIHYLDDVASSVFSDFRPALVASDNEYEALHYQLITMPARPVLFWSLFGGGLICIYMLTIDPARAQQDQLFTSPQATVLELAIAIAISITAAVVIYHTIRQLALVNRIYTQHTRIDLFNLDPLYGFSRLAARTALAGLLLTYAWAVLWPGALQSLSVVGFLAASALLVAATFALPLLGVHSLLRKEKARRKAEAGLHLNAVIEELHLRTAAGDFTQMGSINDALDSLVREREVLAKIPTWPWEPETVRSLATALLLPVVLWIITRILERTIAF